MLNFKEYQEYVLSSLSDMLPKELENATIGISDVIKNNGLVLHGLTVTPEGKNIAPTIYLEPYFGQYMEGKDLDSTLEDIVELAAKHADAPSISNSIAKDFMNFDYIKERVVVVLVNTEKNRELLENTPHIEYEDLSFIYKVLVDDSVEAGMSTITIKEQHLEYWGVNVNDLHEYAMKNSEELLPASVRNLTDLMVEMMGRDGMPEEVIEQMIGDIPPENQMYVITNKSNVNGAAAMFYTDTLSKLSEKLGGDDLYILPSSVHEVIAVSTQMGTPEMLAEMVQEVNGNEVSMEEQLSDHVYKYDAKTKDLTLADTTIEEIKKAAESLVKEVTSEASQETARARHHR